MDRTQNMKNRGLLDKNGFPILDPPKDRNKLQKLCHSRMHIYTVTSDKVTGRYDEMSDLEEHRLELTCRTCGHRIVETKWR